LLWYNHGKLEQIEGKQWFGHIEVHFWMSVLPVCSQSGIMYNDKSKISNKLVIKKWKNLGSALSGGQCWHIWGLVLWIFFRVVLIALDIVCHPHYSESLAFCYLTYTSQILFYSWISLQLRRCNPTGEIIVIELLSEYVHEGPF
jgi:hypothetical protein